jgi:hypothetical protein
VPGNRFEFLEATAACEAVAEGQRDGEPFRPGGLDVLAQHVMARACAGPFRSADLLAEVRSSLAYAWVDEAAFARVASGEAAALAADDVLLAGHIAERGLQRDYAIVGELLSYEPYGIVYARNDAGLDAVVIATFTRLAASGEIRSIYNKWFTRPLPSGIQLRWPMGTQLARTFERLGMAPE